MKLISWNVNGIRAVERKGFKEWFEKESPDILCLQETKARKEQLSAFLQQPKGFYSYFSSAEKKGYSGVVVYSKEKPKENTTLASSAYTPSVAGLMIASYVINRLVGGEST